MTFPAEVRLPPFDFAYIPAPVLKGIPLPPGTMRQVKHDQEAKDDRQRIGYPEVFPLYLAQYCPLTEAWQWFWFRQMVHSHTEYKTWDEKKLSKTELEILKGKWASLTKGGEAYTNFKGTDKFADFIRNLRTDKLLPGQEPLVCCGNIVKVVGADVRKAGQMVTPIETLDGNKPPPDIGKVNRLTAPHLISDATNVAMILEGGKRKPIVLPDGRYRVDPFPQMLHTPVPLRTNGKEAETYTRDGVNYAINFIRASRLKIVTGDIVPSAFVP